MGWRTVVPTTTSTVPGLPSGAACWRSVLTRRRTWQCLRTPTSLHATPPSASRCVLHARRMLSSVVTFAESNRRNPWICTQNCVILKFVVDAKPVICDLNVTENVTIVSLYFLISCHYISWFFNYFRLIWHSSMWHLLFDSLVLNWY